MLKQQGAILKAFNCSYFREVKVYVIRENTTIAMQIKSYVYFCQKHFVDVILSEKAWKKSAEWNTTSTCRTCIYMQ